VIDLKAILPQKRNPFVLYACFCMECVSCTRLV